MECEIDPAEVRQESGVRRRSLMETARSTSGTSRFAHGSALLKGNAMKGRLPTGTLSGLHRRRQLLPPLIFRGPSPSSSRRSIAKRPSRTELASIQYFWSYRGILVG